MIKAVLTGTVFTLTIYSAASYNLAYTHNQLQHKLKALSINHLPKQIKRDNKESDTVEKIKYHWNNGLAELAKRIIGDY